MDKRQDIENMQLSTGELCGRSPMDFKSERAGQYINVLLDLWPLAMIGATLSIFVAMRQIKKSYLQRTPLQVIGNILWSAGLTMALVVGSVSLLELVIPDISPGISVGVAIFVGLFGLKGIDYVVRRKFGLKVMDLRDPWLTASDYSELPEEMHNRHMEACPFRHKCSANDKCKGCGGKEGE